MKLFKKLTAFVLCGVMTAGGLFIYNSYGEQTLRVGLERYYMDVSSVHTSNSSLNIAYSGGSIDLDSSSGFTFEPAGGSFGERTGFKTLDEALSAGGQAVYDEQGWCSYNGTGTVSSASGTAKEQLASDTEEDAAEITTEQINNSSAVSSYTLSDKAVRISYDGGSFIINYSPVTLSSSSGVIDLGEMSYRGKIEITSSGGLLDTVNILTMDQYLYGVVPSEVYAEWPDEALKAQAVAARTYAQYHIGKHSGYDLCDHTHCQQYSGYTKEEASTNRAVDETSGVIAYYNGKPINSVYYDCDGGYTLSAEEVWGSDIPYLQSTPDPYELNARKWERTFTLSEIGALVKANGSDVGNVTNVSITKKRGDILAEEVVITGTNGSIEIKGQDIKTFFRQDEENLWSRCFTISGSSAPANNIYVEASDGNAKELGVNVVSAVSSGGEVTVLDDINLVLRGKNGDVVLSPDGGRVTEAADSIVISGAGWGHGVGMSQCGAYGMASQGYNYKDILKYYYKGIEVK